MRLTHLHRGPSRSRPWCYGAAAAGARRGPTAGPAGTLLLGLGNAGLPHRTRRPHGRAPSPYVSRCCFATALNASIARLDR
ncbi:hypothetical protein ACH4VX_23135 [Streptomyces sp. NPDC020731]|uniref:hypothetical protein n=1 Tax=Streptomyces sp. NPDC020731 TaxID=3365085 RepID=UPI0037920303